MLFVCVGGLKSLFVFNAHQLIFFFQYTMYMYYECYHNEDLGDLFYYCIVLSKHFFHFQGWKEMEFSKFLLAGLVLTSCAVIFQLIGLASPYWITYNFGSSAEVYMGLWKFCTEIIQIKVSTCQDSTESFSEGISMLMIY